MGRIGRTGVQCAVFYAHHYAVLILWYNMVLSLPLEREMMIDRVSR